MTHCNWCGLVSEDDKICSWCKKPFLIDTAATATPSVVRSRERNRNLTAVIVGLCLILLVAWLGIRMQPPTVKQSATKRSAVAAQQSADTSGVPIPPPGNAIGGNVPATIGPGDTAEPVPSDDQSEPTQTDQANQDSTAPAAVAQQGSVKVINASLSARDDNLGNEWAVGAVTIKNDGPYPITDYRIVLRMN